MCLQSSTNIEIRLNHFWPMFTFYNPQKTPENVWFPGVFKRCKMETFARNRLMARELNNTDHTRIEREKKRMNNVRIISKIFLNFSSVNH